MLNIEKGQTFTKRGTANRNYTVTRIRNRNGLLLIEAMETKNIGKDPLAVGFLSIGSVQFFNEVRNGSILLQPV